MMEEVYLLKKNLDRSEKKRINTCKYWRLTPSNNWRWKWKFKKKEYTRRMRKQLGTKIHGSILLKGINIWVVPLVRCSRPFLKWIREQLKLHNVWHPKDDVDRLYVSRKEAGRELASIEYSGDASIRLEDYMGRHGRRLITATKNKTDDTKMKSTNISSKQKWEEKQL